MQQLTWQNVVFCQCNGKHLQKHKRKANQYWCIHKQDIRADQDVVGIDRKLELDYFTACVCYMNDVAPINKRQLIVIIQCLHRQAYEDRQLRIVTELVAYLHRESEQQRNCLQT